MRQYQSVNIGTSSIEFLHVNNCSRARWWLPRPASANPVKTKQYRRMNWKDATIGSADSSICWAPAKSMAQICSHGLSRTAIVEPRSLSGIDFVARRINKLRTEVQL